MHRFLPFIIEINILFLFFYMAYALVFRRFTFHVLHRYYFLFSIIFSLIFPCFFSILKTDNSVVGRLFNELNSLRLNSSTSQAPAYSQVIIYLFYFGALIMLIRLMSILLCIHRIHSKSTSRNFENIKYRQPQEPIAPFSFWKSIYVYSDQHSSKDLKNILLHEGVHIHQFHSADNLLAELITIIGWFNPAVWKLRNAMKLNLEYITDRAVVKKGADFKTYQYSLLSIHNSGKNLTMVSGFSTIAIKKRIIMLNKDTSSKLWIACYALIVPFIFCAIIINRSFRETLNVLSSSADTEYIQISSNEGKQTVYFVNDKLVSKSQVNFVNPKIITSVSISKDHSNSKFSQGGAGIDSVFIFTTNY